MSLNVEKIVVDIDVIFLVKMCIYVAIILNLPIIITIIVSAGASITDLIGK